MNNEQLSDCWDSIAKALGRITKRIERLPDHEQDSEFSEWIDNALSHAERRADALIDPS
ncbi:MAG: hypothetical protein ACYDDI_03335 [Candidatus Acidiferrales bacterium]